MLRIAWHLLHEIKTSLCFVSRKLSQCPCMTHKRGGVLYHNTRNPLVYPLLSFTMLGHSGAGMQANLCNISGTIGQRTSLNLSPLFDHAVIVQSSPGRFLYVAGSGLSHQEADQVIIIISLIPHSGTDSINN